jgi:hypothetical protein
VFRATRDGLVRWLGRAREVVMAPWRQYRAAPNPTAIASTVPLWRQQVDRILPALTAAQREGWAAAHLVGEFDPNDPFIQANIALTYNLLVRIPDEVHAMVVAAILEGSQKAESTEQIAKRVDDIFTFSGSENWENRSRVIAITESTRHRNSSLLAHGLLSESNGRQDISKQWDTTMDNRERPAHRDANNQVRSLGQPFIVDDVLMMFPGDPLAPPDLVCGCRCDLKLLLGKRA